ncbi:single-stranded DNA-binding protein, mitochondrial [Strongylocentrotus purpuratus]|uniref:Single-stranded DNA-binding protein n=1 Tax=Strongylocentrotus purpuratus TaxID=7668 RepID=A0A7M7P092_STRPU|nr:single-stranded DNA-binding protein, mitochondrial [Strongylocentrotus purpuratus]
MFRLQLQRVCFSAVRIGQFRQMQQKAERSVNQVTLLGRVGKDVELKGSDEHPMASFSLATSENIRSKDPDEIGDFTQKTSWHRICIFKPGLVDIVYTYCKKGDRLYVTGKLDYSEYTNNDGIKVYQTSVIADEVIFLTSENRRDGY